MTLQGFLRIVEIRTKIVSVSAVAIGTAFAALHVPTLDIRTFLVFFSAVLAVDMATTGFNTFFDFFFGVDRKDTNRESDKVLVHQGVAAGPALLVSLSLYGVAMVLGVVLAVVATPWVIPIGAACMVVGFAYNAGPLPISRTPVGELFAGGFLGWVLVTLTVFTQSPQSLPTGTGWVGLPSLLLVASILTVNNTCDIDGDLKAGRKTLSIVLGRRGGEVLVYVLGVLGFGTGVTLALVGIVPPITAGGLIVAAGLSLPHYVAMHRNGYSHATKGPSMGRITRIFRWYSLGYAVPMALVAAKLVPPAL